MRAVPFRELVASGEAPRPGPAFDNPLGQYFLRNAGRLIHKWHHYFEIYHRHLERFRGHSPVVVEFGVSHGGSVQMWREYFGAGAQIIGIDIDPRCRAAADESIEILIGDQADRDFLASLRTRHPRVDVVIDDGGHTMEQQVATFQELYPHIEPHGVYICEDVHTSYMPHFGGVAKSLIDGLHAWYFTQPGQQVDRFPLSVHGMHFYDSMVVLEKRPMERPRASMTGKPSF